MKRRKLPVAYTIDCRLHGLSKGPTFPAYRSLFTRLSADLGGKHLSPLETWKEVTAICREMYPAIRFYERLRFTMAILK
jgi:hypothetical protein